MLVGAMSAALLVAFVTTTTGAVPKRLVFQLPAGQADATDVRQDHAGREHPGDHQGTDELGHHERRVRVRPSACHGVLGYG